MAPSSALRVRTGLAPGPASLCDALDSLLETGIVAAAEIRIKVADVDLLYIALELVACSWEKAQALPRGGGTRQDQQDEQDADHQSCSYLVNPVRPDANRESCSYPVNPVRTPRRPRRRKA